MQAWSYLCFYKSIVFLQCSCVFTRSLYIYNIVVNLQQPCIFTMSLCVYKIIVHLQHSCEFTRSLYLLTQRTCVFTKALYFYNILVWLQEYCIFTTFLCIYRSIVFLQHPCIFTRALYFYNILVYLQEGTELCFKCVYSFIHSNIIITIEKCTLICPPSLEKNPTRIKMWNIQWFCKFTKNLEKYKILEIFFLLIYC